MVPCKGCHGQQHFVFQLGLVYMVVAVLLVLLGHLPGEGCGGLMLYSVSSA